MQKWGKAIMVALSLSVLFVPKAKAVSSLEGVASVEVRSKRVLGEFDQAISIEGNKATFEGLSDFGTTSFRIQFTKSGLVFLGGDKTMSSEKVLKKLLSLPLNQNQFMSIMRFEKPRDFHEEENESLVWIQNGKKGVRVEFLPVLKKAGVPEGFTIRYKKNSFELKWLKIKTRP